MKYTLLTLTATLLSVHAQQEAIPGQQFVDDPLSVVIAGAPAWHFDEDTCFPKAADDGNGGKDTGLESDRCNMADIKENCPEQPPFKGPGTQAAGFPTYYTIRYCESDASWRVAYDVYFPKDSSHRYDWEFAVLKWKKQESGEYLRDGMWINQHSEQPYVPWAKFLTYNGDADIDSSAKGKNHAKLYFSKTSHAIFKDTYTIGSQACTAVTPHEYRSDDYRWEARDLLVDGKEVPTEWDFEDKTVPSQFLAGGKKDLCGDKFN